MLFEAKMVATHEGGRLWARRGFRTLVSGSGRCTLAGSLWELIQPYMYDLGILHSNKTSQNMDFTWTVPSISVSPSVGEFIFFPVSFDLVGCSAFCFNEVNFRTTWVSHVLVST